jgi:DNA-binding XRE family transcriptional regulator
MKKKFLGSSVEDTIKEWHKKDPAMETRVEQLMEKKIMAALFKNIRKQTGYSQAELARKAGMPQPAIARIESDTSTVLPRLDLYTRLLSVMGYRLILSAERMDKGGRRLRHAA